MKPHEKQNETTDMTERHPLELRAMAAGISGDLAAIMCCIVIHVEKDKWDRRVWDWIGSEEEMFALALREPEKTYAAYELVCFSDGLREVGGCRYLCMSQEKREKIEAWMFGKSNVLGCKTTDGA